MAPIVEVKELYKSYESVNALNGISFEVQTGEMFCLVGPDGAGKTTIIRTLCGLLGYEQGSAKIFGLEVKKNRKTIQNQLGYLSQKFSLYGDLSIDENIEFFAEIHNVKNYEFRRNELLEFTRLLPFRNRRAEKLSGGMKQKLALACSLIHKPRILFLDEPTTGVDPVSRRDFWKILADLMKEGTTIFMSTPYLDEAERGNTTALINEGKIIELAAPDAIKEAIPFTFVEFICRDSRKAFKIMSEKFKDFEIQLFGDKIHIALRDKDKELTVIREALKKYEVETLNERIIPPSLENAFIYLLK